MEGEAMKRTPLAQRVLPSLLASAPAEALGALRDQVGQLPRCAALFRQPVPIALF